ncbi:hypothetical protein C8F01DRAFT_1242340 [Mycena amicta]|nr:hypothetical protein C8F01DRAFT_1242340 [Mycena amicta]
MLNPSSLLAILFLASSHSSSSPIASPSRIKAPSQDVDKFSMRRTRSSLSALFFPAFEFDSYSTLQDVVKLLIRRLKTFRKILAPRVLSRYLLQDT